ncbi:hypothetical protein [Pseudomonas asiatica]|nr:hypothetical protein [Pseudomonas asiatica]
MREDEEIRELVDLLEDAANELTLMPRAWRITLRGHLGPVA